jgi:hypothetical protein
MRIKIITKSGREYLQESENQIYRYDDTDFNVITYKRIDAYYHGDKKYREQKTVLTINRSSIESIDYR